MAISTSIITSYRSQLIITGKIPTLLILPLKEIYKDKEELFILYWSAVSYFLNIPEAVTFYEEPVNEEQRHI